MHETQEIRFQFLGQEDPLELEMATHFSILACKIPWTEEPGRQQSMGSQKSQTRLSIFVCMYMYIYIYIYIKFHIYIYKIKDFNQHFWLRDRDDKMHLDAFI